MVAATSRATRAARPVLRAATARRTRPADMVDVDIAVADMDVARRVATAAAESAVAAHRAVTVDVASVDAARVAPAVAA
jgi:hypothetical protein